MLTFSSFAHGAVRCALSFRRMSTAAPALVAGVKQLRDLTGAPMMECKAALVAEGNDIEKAVAWLRKKGLTVAGKKSSREAAQGLIAVEVSKDGSSASIIEFNSETDFVARNDQFQSLTRRLVNTALHSLPPCTAWSPLAGVTGLRSASAEELQVLKSKPLSSSGGEAGAQSSPEETVDAAVASLIGVIRENMVLRRAATVSVTGGVISAYVHNSVSVGLGAIGVLVALAPATSGGAAIVPGSESAAAAHDLGKRIAMHIAAANPVYLSRATVPPAALAAERAVHEAQAAGSNKPHNIVVKMVEGKLSKWYAERVLLDQAFALTDDGTTVGQLVKNANLQDKRLAGSAVQVAGFIRYAVGEATPGAIPEAA